MANIGIIENREYEATSLIFFLMNYILGWIGFLGQRIPSIEIVMNLHSRPLKVKSISLWKAFKKLTWGNFAYKVEKSKVQIDLALFSLFSFFMASITWLLIGTPRRYLPLLKICIYRCNFCSNYENWNANVIVLARYL